jgi:hypothetical protein
MLGTDGIEARGPWARRTLALPAIAVAVLPKCPMCVMVALGALGVAPPHHGRAFMLLQGAVPVLMVSLLAIRHRHAPRRIALAIGGAGAVMLGLTGMAAPVVGYGGAILLAVVWLARKPGVPATSCGCAL